jgi:hypothetical protein
MLEINNEFGMILKILFWKKLWIWCFNEVVFLKYIFTDYFLIIEDFQKNFKAPKFNRILFRDYKFKFSQFIYLFLLFNKFRVYKHCDSNWKMTFCCEVNWKKIELFSQLWSYLVHLTFLILFTLAKNSFLN